MTRVALVLACLAIGLLSAGCHAGATRGQVLYADALEHLALGDSTAALQLLQEAAWEIPDHAPIRFLLGELYVSQGTIESRARAEKELRRAGDLAPQEALYAAVLGELLHTQGFHHDSQTELRRALGLDPRLARAWFHLGLELQAEFVEEPTSARLRDSTLVCFERALDADTTLAEARYRLAYLLLLRGQPERAREVARRGLAAGPCPVRFGPLLAAIEFRARQFDAASQVLDSTLACMRPAERVRLLEPIALQHPDSIFCFDCTLPARDSALVHYWWARDPTPTTLVNERLLEHVARIVDADFYFEVPALGLAGRDTDRGEIWLRYGSPDRMWRDIDANVRSWRWNYAKPGGIEEFLFLDTYLSGKYVRVRRRAGGDFMHKEMMEEAPERGRFRLGPEAPGWRYALREFRAASGRRVVELAFAFDRRPPADSIRVELAAWRAPRERLAVRARSYAVDELWKLGASDRRLGRLRFELPAETVELGLEALAVGGDPRQPAGSRLVWATTSRDTLPHADRDSSDLAMSDLLPAHELRDGHGGLFDFGGVIAVPRVDRPIPEGQLHLYFEIYPGAALLSARRTLAITYRVQEMPGPWRFRDQFSAERRARAQRRTAVESTFELRPRVALERQQLTIDLRNVPPGQYRLTIEVRPYAGRLLASRSLDFEIPSRPADDS